MDRRDSCVVYNRDGDLDKAIKIFKRQVGSYGVFRALKFRDRYPSKGDRKRAKALRARQRIERAKNRGNL